MSGGPCQYEWVDEKGIPHECMKWTPHRSFHRCCCNMWADE